VELSNLNIKNGLCISLGANIDSKFGSPLESLLMCKPKIEEIINEWGDNANKQKEAEYAIEKGAEELDLVPNYFALKEGNIELFAEEINQISELGIPVRVIIDANILFNSSKLTMAIDALIDAGAIGIQIGNGFGPSVSKDQTINVSKIVKNRCSIKTVGGIKTFDQAIEIIEAGSTYIGTSFGFEITQEQKKKE